MIHFRNSIPVVHMDNKADHNESLCCNVVILNSLITLGFICLKPNSTEAENEQNQNPLKKFSNKGGIIKGDLNYGNIR